MSEVLLPGDLFFGMSPDSFAQHCRAGNLAGRFSAGREGFVVYDLPDSVRVPSGRLAFLPVFIDGELVELRARIFSEQFNPFDKSLYADSLTTNVEQYVGSVVGISNLYPAAGYSGVLGGKKGAIQVVARATIGQDYELVFSDLRRMAGNEGEAGRLLTDRMVLHPSQFGGIDTSGLR